MKAGRFHEVGGPQVLRYEEIDQPIPDAGQVRLRVAASAFSAADNGMRAGLLPIPVVLRTSPDTTCQERSTPWVKESTASLWVTR